MSAKGGGRYRSAEWRQCERRQRYRGFLRAVRSHFAFAVVNGTQVFTDSSGVKDLSFPGLDWRTPAVPEDIAFLAAKPSQSLDPGCHCGGEWSDSFNSQQWQQMQCPLP
ncbi:hypothetical protein LIA77_02096 [Sarocladium implicatum]|nr:hypothetical protein LIA77_02096 [Sarocladium implicatum]